MALRSPRDFISATLERALGTRRTRGFLLAIAGSIMALGVAVPLSITPYLHKILLADCAEYREEIVELSRLNQERKLLLPLNTVVGKIIRNDEK